MIKKGGFTLISALISIMILAFISLALYSLFLLSLNIISENKYRVTAVSLATQRMEMVRNLPYDSVGTIGGIPNGTIPQNEQVRANEQYFTLLTQIIYIDDPFDGLIGGVPPDLLNTDYKRVKITATWPSRFGQNQSVILMTDVAPKSIETTAVGGTLLIKVFNANGDPVPLASVHIVNNQVTPNILIDAQTTNDGTLIFPGAPPSQQSYEITATKAGYSTDYTSPVTVQNPNPTKPHASVFQSQITEISFAIDLVSIFDISTVSQELVLNWKINNDVSGAVQENPDVAVSGDNYYYFAWRDYRTGQSRIYAQKYDTNKTKQWVNDVAITSSNNQNYPRLAADPVGNFYVAWQDDRNGNQDIYMQKFTASGAEVWTGSKKINTDAGSKDQTQPVIYASSTTIFVTWQDNRNNNLDVYAQKYNTDGDIQWSNDLKINTNSGNTNQSYPSIAATSTDCFYVAWMDSRNGGSNYDIYAQKYDASGNKLWTNDLKVNTNSGTSHQRYPAVAIDKNNNLIFVWQDNRNVNSDVYAQKYDASGNKLWTNDLKVNTDGGTTNQIYPAVAINNDNEIFFTWQDNRNGDNDVYAQKYDTDGNILLSSDVKINSNSNNSDQKRPRIAADYENNGIFTWTDNRDSTYDIYAARFYEPGNIINIPNIPLRIIGSKTIGNNPIIYKYNELQSTNGSGLLTLNNMEWDSYTVVPTSTSYELINSLPGQPINLLPDTTTPVILNLE